MAVQGGAGLHEVFCSRGRKLLFFAVIFVLRASFSEQEARASLPPLLRDLHPQNSITPNNDIHFSSNGVTEDSIVAVVQGSHSGSFNFVSSKSHHRHPGQEEQEVARQNRHERVASSPASATTEARSTASATTVSSSAASPSKSMTTTTMKVSLFRENSSSEEKTSSSSGSASPHLSTTTMSAARHLDDLSGNRSSNSIEETQEQRTARIRKQYDEVSTSNDEKETEFRILRDKRDSNHEHLDQSKRRVHRTSVPSMGEEEHRHNADHVNDDVDEENHRRHRSRGGMQDKTKRHHGDHGTSRRNKEEQYLKALNNAQEGASSLRPSYSDNDVEAKDGSIHGLLDDVSEREFTSTELHSEQPTSAEALSRQKKAAIKMESYDTTCLRIVDGKIQFIPAPDVANGKMKYNRRKNKKPPYNTFLEAIYTCDEGYLLAVEEQDRLFCSMGLWNGRRPQCLTPQEMREALLLTNSVSGGDDASDKDNGVESTTLGHSKGQGQCSVNNGGCEHICSDSAGVKTCSCKAGYELQLNGINCVDVNECLMRNGHGPCQDSCTNTEGSYICGCEGIPGTQLGPDKHTCEDIDECATLDKFGCSHICINTLGTAFCSCPVGFVLGSDWKTCQDVDECQDDAISSTCTFGCINTPGSYSCSPDPSTSSSVEPGRQTSDSKGDTRKVIGFNNEISIDGIATASPASPTMMAISPTYSPEPSSNPVKRNSSKGKENGKAGKTGKSGKSNKADQYEDYYYEEYGDENDYYYDGDEKDGKKGKVDKVKDNGKDSDDYDEDKEEEDANNIPEEEDSDQEVTEEPEIPQAPTQPPPAVTTTTPTPTTSHSPATAAFPEVPVAVTTSTPATPYYTTERVEITTTARVISHHHHHVDTDSDRHHQEEDKGGDGEGHQSSTVAPDGSGDDEEKYESNRDVHGHTINYVTTTTPSPTYSPAVGTTSSTASVMTTTTGRPTLVISTPAVIKVAKEIPKEEYEDDYKDGEDDYYSSKEDPEEDEYDGKNEIGGSDARENEVDTGDGKETEGDTGDVRENEVDTADEKDSENDAGDVRENEVDSSYQQTTTTKRPVVVYTSTTQPTTTAMKVESTTTSAPRTTTAPATTTTTAATTTTMATTPTLGATTSAKPKSKPKPIDNYSDEYEEGEEDYYGENREEGYDYYEERDKKQRGKEKGKEDAVVPEVTPAVAQKEIVTTTTATEVRVETPVTTTTMKPTEVPIVEEPEEEDDEYEGTNEVDQGEDEEGQPTGVVTTVKTVVTTTTTEAPKPVPICDAGLRWNPISEECVDLDECEEGFGCSHICINTYGSAYCDCPSGLELQEDDKTCREPFDPCAENNGGCEHICSRDEDDGSAKCLCPAGYTSAGPEGKSCEDVDECTLYAEICSSTVPHSMCTNTPGSYLCKCLPGFQDIDGQCFRMNPCAEANGGCSHLCTSRSDGSHECSCKNGYALGPDGKSCVDIDECVFEETCDSVPNSECSNSAGSYSCVCMEGFVKDGSGACVRKDPCLVDNGGCSHYCRDAGDGEVVCSCPDGYDLDEDDQSCIDINECLEEKACTRDHSYCFNTAGSYVCECDLGFKYSDELDNCVDENECEEDNFGCAQRCENVNGHAFCSCFAGYRLDSDGKNCLDNDECLTSPCGPGTCINTNGGYECLCPEGYESRQGRCEDINECLYVKCAGICENTVGSYTCRNPCEKGFLYQDGACIDVNECSSNGTCLPNEDCINTPGSYLCLIACAPGFERNPETRVCLDVNECEEEEPCETGECINTVGSYRCLTPCPSGYERIEMECMDIDECLVLKDPCGEDLCMNLPGSFSCIKRCEEGYELVSGECVDIDECLMDEEACPEKTKCLNTPGSYHCRLECPPGFEEKSGECFDVDECLEYVCQNGLCINTDGSYFCTCDPGYSPVAGVCVDVNECESSPCGHGECINKPGSYYCFCSPGYAFLNGTCADVDECSNSGICPGGSCVNTKGSYYCKCNTGYQLINGVCTDIDECKEDPCFAGKCENTPGSYTCHCDKGFSKVNDICVDINECEERKCSGGECINTYGSYMCFCPPGFENIDGNCTDIDECKNDPCRGAPCINTPGSYKCKCSAGFRLVQGRCRDIDECSSGKNPCSSTGSCVNTPGSYKCVCPRGYHLENGSCVDIDECAVNNGRCEHTCHNLPGTFKCSCLPGYQGDYRNATQCLDINECSFYNGGCSHDCINTKGSYQCGCSDDYTIGSDKKTCIPSSGLCGSFTAPKNGLAVCQESRKVGNESFSPGAWCRVNCDSGFKLDGSYYSYCGRDGRWHGRAGVCVPLHCNKLPVPKHGRVWPPNCSKGKTFVNSKCYFSCDIGYYLIGDPIWTCQSSLEWKSNGKRKKNRCKKQGLVQPIKDQRKKSKTLAAAASSTPATKTEANNIDSYATSGPVRIGTSDTSRQPPQLVELHLQPHHKNRQPFFWGSQGQTTTTVVPPTAVSESSGKFTGKNYGQQRHLKRMDNIGLKKKHFKRGNYIDFSYEMPKPFIQCPPDVKVTLAPHQSTAHVKFAHPKSNVDRRYIEAEPYWASRLEGDFKAGKTRIEFRATSPAAQNSSASCSFVINIVDTEQPTVFQCPASFEVRLPMGQSKMKVYWQAPKFTDNVGVAHIFNNHDPGMEFEVGKHRSYYIAVDEAGNRARCHFTITVSPRECYELQPPRHGSLNCRSFGDGFMACSGACHNGYLPYTSMPRRFICGPSRIWKPSGDVPECSAFTRQTDSGCLPGFEPRFLRESLCVACPPGMYNPDGQAACVQCPIGTYQSEFARESCQKCSSGKTTSATGAKSVADCYDDVPDDILGVLPPATNHKHDQ